MKILINKNQLKKLASGLINEQKVDAPLDGIFKKLRKNDYSIIHQDSKWIVVVPHTEKASCWLGVNTQWPTTYGKHSLNKEFSGIHGNPFEELDGDLYIIINKQDENEKYQFYIEGEQFVDKDDKDIDLKSFYRANKSLSDLFKKIGDDMVEQYGDGTQSYWDLNVDLNLSYLPITSLGNLKEVGGDLNLAGSSIASLGNLERVGGSLDVSYTPLKSLGELKFVGRDLFAMASPITSLGALKQVGGDLDLNKSQITSLGNLERVGLILDLSNTPITSLGNLKHVGKYLNLSNTPLSRKYSTEQLEEMYPQFKGKIGIW